MPSALPLAGVRVLDFTRHMPGPYTTSVLGDLGAEIVKVEEPGVGDPTRALPPMIPDGSDGAVHAWLNRGKRSIAIDLKSKGGRDVARRLASRADVVVESYRTGVAKRLGIDYASVKRLNPHVVYVSVSGYGASGPFAGRASHDLNAGALAGLIGDRGDVPPTLLADTSAGLYAALQVTALLRGARSKRRAAQVDVSMYDGAMVLMGLPFQRALMTGGAAPGLHGDYACYRNYRCRDGRFVAVAALEPEFFARVCEILDLARHRGAQWSETKQSRVVADFEAAFASKDSSEWVRAFDGEDVCVEPVLRLSDVLASGLARARSAFGRQRGKRSSFATPLLFASSNAFPALSADRTRPKAPALGEHTDAVLRSLKYSRARIKALRAQGVVA